MCASHLIRSRRSDRPLGRYIIESGHPASLIGRRFVFEFALGRTCKLLLTKNGAGGHGIRLFLHPRHPLGLRVGEIVRLIDAVGEAAEFHRVALRLVVLILTRVKQEFPFADANGTLAGPGSHQENGIMR